MEETPTRSPGHGTDRPARQRRNASPAGPNPTSHQARQRRVDEADSACSIPRWTSPSRLRAQSRVKVGCPSSLRPRFPSRDRSSRSHDLPCLGSLPDPGALQAEAWAHFPPPASPRRRRDRGRAKGSSSSGVGKPTTGSEPSGSARRPGPRAIPTKSTPFQGRRDPASHRPCTAVRRALTRKPHAAPDSCREDGYRRPTFTRKEGEAK